MYQFTDTIDLPQVQPLMPESVSINGVYIENAISGYKTLNVSGRELLNANEDDYTIGNMTGAYYRSRKYDTREIVVTYQLLADTDAEFRSKYNQLNAILDVEQAQIIFADEPDKYFVATKTKNSQVDPGRNSVTGEITFFCADPRKYALEEKTFEFVANADGILEATVENEGTQAVPINYEVTMNHENGFIGLIADEEVLQYGLVEEEDTIDAVRSTQMINANRYDDFDGYWGLNDAGLSQMLFQSDMAINGTLREVTHQGKSYVALGSQGSGNAWHGASFTRNIDTSQTADPTLINFKANLKTWFEMSRVSDTGVLMWSIADTDSQRLMSITLTKTTLNSQDGFIHLWVQGQGVVKSIKWQPNNQSLTSLKGGWMHMLKNHDYFEFNVLGKTYGFTFPALEQKSAEHIGFYLGQYGNFSNLMTRMYVESVIFRRDDEYLYDIPNRYAAGDVMEVDGKEGIMTVNGVAQMEDEIVGSRYFKAEPGRTVIQLYTSTFSDPAPTATATIREAWL